MSYFRARSDLARALSGHPEAAALLHNLDVALGVERNEARVQGQYEAAKPKEIPENPTEWRDKVDFLQTCGCNVVLAVGPFGIGCRISDPEMTHGINRRADSLEKAVDQAFSDWQAAQPVEAV